MPLIALTVLLILNGGDNPLHELRSPVILYRQDRGSKDWVATNNAITQLSTMSSKEQISCQMSFIDKAYSWTAGDRAFLAENRGRPFEYHPVYDIGKLDLIRIALGKPVTLAPIHKLMFVERDPNTKQGVRRSLDHPVYPSSVHHELPVRILEEATFVRARRFTRLGYYVVPHPGSMEPLDGASATLIWDGSDCLGE